MGASYGLFQAFVSKYPELSLKLFANDHLQMRLIPASQARIATVCFQQKRAGSQ